MNKRPNLRQGSTTLAYIWQHLNQRSLTTQIILNFVVLVVITAIVAGLPAVLLIRNQSENQAWAQVEQGSRATRALLLALQKEVDGLALLTAQRPSVLELLAQGKKVELQQFLLTLQEGTGLGLLVVCDHARQTVAFVGDLTVGDLCHLESAHGYYVAPANASSRLWLLAAEPIGGTRNTPGFVIVGVALNNSFASEIHGQTGLEHIFLIDEELVASSLPPEAARTASRLLAQQDNETFTRSTLSLNGFPYYAARLTLGQPGVVDEVALEVTDITLTQRRLISIMTSSIFLVAVVGSMLGVLLARRIGRPLRALTQTATTLSTGQLDTAVTVQSQVQEVTMVAQALEKARADLQRTLHELRQTNAWNDHLLESISEGIVVLDENGRVSFFSPGAERITGWAQAHVYGRACDEVFHLVDIDEPFSRLLPQSGQPYKVTLALTGQRQVTLTMTSAPLSLPSIGKAGIALVFRDISDTERIHHLLGHFLANITHEFRTPLSALAASAELLIDQGADLSLAESQELLNSLHLGILGLQTLIDNLLESASLEAGRFRIYPRPTDLHQIITEATNTMKPLQDKYGQQVRLELSATLSTVQADPRRTTQVLINLLSNAIKYSPDGAEITITAADHEGLMRVAIADQGPGVPPGYRPNLFRRLIHPSANIGKAHYGVGLGLSVVKAIVEAHGGQVGVDDRPGGGSIFWFTLPKG